MPCFHPLSGYRASSPNPGTGKYNILFDAKKAPKGAIGVSVPCGRCMGCRLEKSRQWAMRCVHEASLHKANCFITLTYDDAHLPSDKSLDVTHFQLFMKRLRKRYGSGIRFFHCGEYGDLSFRPHYHACIFNFDFPDKQPFALVGGNQLFVSKSLGELWPQGFSTIGALTFESAAYVARYVTKKITGPMAEDHYKGRKPEYITMSRRPGIAAGWFSKYCSDVYPSDSVVMRGVEMKPPKFYDRIFELENPEVFAMVKACREQEALRRTDAEVSVRLEQAFACPGRIRCPPSPLRVKEIIQHSRFKQLKRGLDNAS